MQVLRTSGGQYFLLFASCVGLNVTPSRSELKIDDRSPADDAEALRVASMHPGARGVDFQPCEIDFGSGLVAIGHFGRKPPVVGASVSAASFRATSAGVAAGPAAPAAQPAAESPAEPATATTTAPNKPRR